MSQPYDRIYNFSAGPCTLPVSVLEEAKEDLLNYKGSGMSVMEMSHRGKVFDGIAKETESSLRQLMEIPPEYKVLFLQGGASLQFTMLAMNFLSSDRVGDYVITGSWGQKAVEAACLAGAANTVWDGKPTNFDRAPDLRALSYSSRPAYIHFTSNETIQGVDFLSDPTDLPAPVICDMSSNILSRPCKVSDYQMIYAGAQKNMGPAGVVITTLSPEMIDRVPGGLPPMLDYRLQSENESMYNTPPCWSMYVCGLVFKHLLANGGLQAQEKLNIAKAQVIYDAIDGSNGFYRGHSQPASRSLMNVTFTLGSDELTEAFLKGAKEHRLDGLKGHRSVGGCRASIYNAFPLEGCQVLAEYMASFAKTHG